MSQETFGIGNGFEDISKTQKALKDFRETHTVEQTAEALALHIGNEVLHDAFADFDADELKGMYRRTMMEVEEDLTPEQFEELYAELTSQHAEAA